MDRKNLLERFEHQLEKVIEQPFTGAPPFDVEQLKARLRAAVAETSTPYVPDRWFVRLPESLRARDGEVRAWVDTVWRSLVASVDPENWAAGVTPQIDVTYDRTLSGDQMMVGYEFSVASGPLYSAKPRSRAGWARDAWDTQVRPRLVQNERRPARRTDFLSGLLKMVAVVSLVLGIGLAIAVSIVEIGRSQINGITVDPSTLPRIEAPRIALPSIEIPQLKWPNLEIPNLLASSSKEYTARTNLRVRREPSANAQEVGTIAQGERLRVMDQQIVQGEAVEGESRWVDITPSEERLRGQHRYVWFGGLEPR